VLVWHVSTGVGAKKNMGLGKNLEWVMLAILIHSIGVVVNLNCVLGW